MPQREQHLDQAQDNEQLSLALEADGHYAWAVTVLFYAALHLVDAYLVGTGVQPANHGERNRVFRGDARLAPVWQLYRDLDDRSRDARYRCITFSAADAGAARVQYFAPLQRYVEELLGAN